ATGAGKGGAFFVKNIHECARYDEEPLAGTNLEAGRNERRVENKTAGTIAKHARHRQGHKTFRVLSLENKANVFAPQLNLLFVAAGIFVGKCAHFGPVTQFEFLRFRVEGAIGTFG